MGAAGRPLNGIDNPEQLGRQSGDPHQNEKERPTSHMRFLLNRTFVLALL
jgi:hypothetical protein